MKLKFYKTIRFKLTLWYSLLLIGAGLILLITINVLVANHLNRGYAEVLPPKIQTQIEEFIIGFPSNGGPGRIVRFNELLQDVRQQDLKQLQQFSVVTFVGMMVISFLGGYIIADQMLKPIQKVTDATKEISAKNLNTQIYHDVDDEIGELVHSFNAMTSRLDRSFIAQKEFVQNAAHELKTPLAVMQTNLEATMLNSKLKQEQVEQIERAISSVKFMGNLVDDLLLLASLEGKPLDQEKLELGKLLGEVVRQLEPISEQDNNQLILKPDKAKTEISGHELLVQQAIRNVIENSIKYSEPDQEVRVELRRAETQAVIEIEDSGSGIPEAELNRIFDRFYRVDKSRSRASGGSGLGLSIVKQIIELHQGDIEVTSRLGTGTKVLITFPLYS